MSSNLVQRSERHRRQRIVAVFWFECRIERMRRSSKERIESEPRSSMLLSYLEWNLEHRAYYECSPMDTADIIIRSHCRSPTLLSKRYPRACSARRISKVSSKFLISKSLGEMEAAVRELNNGWTKKEAKHCRPHLCYLEHDASIESTFCRWEEIPGMGSSHTIHRFTWAKRR